MARLMSYLYVSEESKIALNFEICGFGRAHAECTNLNVRGHNAITTWKK